ncbi:MAG TPA: radical SAM protein [Nitrospirae bacterium]|nr:radical SAM protein [Nitrospirota bacterium]
MNHDLKLALVNVVMDGDYQYEQEIPLGLASLGSFIRQKGTSVQFHQCFASRGMNEIKRVASISADVFGFQLNMVNFNNVKSAARELKENNKDAVIVLGGPFLVMIAEDILINEQLFDFIVIGDGEYVLLELIEALENQEDDYKKIDGLVWRDKTGHVIKNALRPGATDLDILPFAARDFIMDCNRDPVDGRITESIRMFTSRGCAGTCSFCAVNDLGKATGTRRWRGRSPTNVVDELELLVNDYGVRLFNFSDSSFEDPGARGKRRTREICRQIIDRRLSLSAKIYMRCDSMKGEDDIKLLRFFKKAGIDVIIPGAEAGTDDELNYYDKPATAEDNIRTMEILRDLDLFYVLVGFIMFGPNSTKQSLLENIEFLRKYKLTDSLMQLANVLMLVPGTKLYRRLKGEDRLIESSDFSKPPKYTFIDPAAKAMASHWANLYSRFPITQELNSLQINLGNLISRMTNTMNAPILKELKNEYMELEDNFRGLSERFGDLNYEYFKESLWQIEHNCPEEKMKKMANQHFGETHKQYLPHYSRLYNEFLNKVSDCGFSMSGLVFRHFYSTATTDGTERV